MDCLFGRKVIYTDEDIIDDGNVIRVVSTALTTHLINSRQIDYLDRYNRGDQPILSKEKEFRPEINNKVVENRANEITNFKVGYLVGKPIKYVSRENNDEVAELVGRLNKYMLMENKHTCDTELVHWFTVGGVGYRLILPNKAYVKGKSPFKVYVLDPRYTFVVYRSGFTRKPMLGVTYYMKADGTVVFDVYSSNHYWRFENGADIPIISEYHIYGGIPIIEYRSDESRLGAFEIVVPILNAINNVTSDRLDSIKAFVEAILLIKGFDLSDEQLKQLKELGGLKAPVDGDAKYLTAELNQMQTQTLVDYMDTTVRIICSIPGRNENASGGDNGIAIVYRNGWTDAETYAENTESYFQESEKRFLEIAVNIMNILENTDLDYADVETVFTRRNYENDQTKINNLISMLNCDKIHPRIAWQLSGIAADPESFYKISEEYYQKTQVRLIEAIGRQVNEETDDEESEVEETDV